MIIEQPDYNHIPTDERLRYALPKLSPLCVLLEGERYLRVNLVRIHNESEITGKVLEGWASFIRDTINATGLESYFYCFYPEPAISLLCPRG